MFKVANDFKNANTPRTVRFTENIFDELNKIAQENDRVTSAYLFKKRAIKTTKNGLKILGNGTLNKKLTVRANKFSQGARDAILKAGGKLEVVAVKKSGAKSAAAKS